MPQWVCGKPLRSLHPCYTMSRTYGLIGSRPDLGTSLAHAQLKELGSPEDATKMWGLGFFDKDEVLLRRGPAGQDPSHITDQLKSVRSHAFLAHECDGAHATPSTEATPPLRYGHVLFACQGVSENAATLLYRARPKLPDFLRSRLRGETFSELALAIFLSELPPSSLDRTRLREPRRSVDPLQPQALARALRSCTSQLDDLADSVDCPRFVGDLWIHSGEVMMVAHREGNLGLQLLRGKSALPQLGFVDPEAVGNLENSLFVTVLATKAPLPPSWEQLPDQILLTIVRGEPPHTEAL